MVSLSVEFAGVKMRCPIGVAPLALMSPASIVPERYAEKLMTYVNMGVGYVYTPVTCAELEHPKEMLPTTRWKKIETRGFGREGLLFVQDADRVQWRIKPSVKLIRILKEKVPEGVAVIGDILGPGSDPDGWAEHAKRIEEAGADLIELDVSCECPLAETGVVDVYLAKAHKLPRIAGLIIGDSLELLEPIVRAVVKAVKVPIGIKLSAETGFPRLVSFAKVIKDSGAKWITAINNPVTVCPPDIYNEGKPTWPYLDSNMFLGTSGPWDRYSCYRNMAAISIYCPGIDLAGVGGLVIPEHHIEAMMLGAKITELSSGLIWGGTDILKQTIAFLNRYMRDHGYETPEDFRGLALKYFKPIKEVDWKIGRLIAVTDYEKCDGCGTCAKNVCFATYMKGGKARVIEEECTGCALCEAICPKGARKVVPK